MIKKCKIQSLLILLIVLNTLSGFSQTTTNEIDKSKNVQKNSINKKQKSASKNNSNANKSNSAKTDTSQVEGIDIRINIIDTYERTLNKGYKSIEMLKKVGDARYFEGNLILSAKWYSQLFDLTTDLENQYYFRYSRSLTAISQFEKANEMMKIFDEKSSKK